MLLWLERMLIKLWLSNSVANIFIWVLYQNAKKLHRSEYIVLELFICLYQYKPLIIKLL